MNKKMENVAGKTYIESLAEKIAGKEYAILKSGAKFHLEQAASAFYVRGEKEYRSHDLETSTTLAVKRAEDGGVTAELIHHYVDYSHTRAAAMADIIAQGVEDEIRERESETARVKADRLMERVFYSPVMSGHYGIAGVCKEMEEWGKMRCRLNDKRTGEDLRFTLTLDRGHILYAIAERDLPRAFDDETRRIVEAELIEPLCDEVYNAYWERHTTDDPMQFVRENFKEWLEDKYEDPESGLSVYIEGKTADGKEWFFDYSEGYGAFGSVNDDEFPEDFCKNLEDIAGRMKEELNTEWEKAAA